LFFRLQGLRVLGEPFLDLFLMESGFRVGSLGLGFSSSGSRVQGFRVLGEPFLDLFLRFQGFRVLRRLFPDLFLASMCRSARPSRRMLREGR